MKKLRHLSHVVLLFLAFAIPIALLIRFNHEFRLLEGVVKKTGVFAPFISILIMGLLSATPIPTDPIVILNGALFGPFIGVLVSWMGNNTAAVIEYFLGRGVKRLVNFETQKKKLPFGLDKLPVDSFVFLFFGRLIPQVGGKLVSVAAGVYEVNFYKYFWVAVVSNLLGSIILALGGYSLLHLI